MQEIFVFFTRFYAEKTAEINQSRRFIKFQELRLIFGLLFADIVNDNAAECEEKQDAMCKQRSRGGADQIIGDPQG